MYLRNRTFVRVSRVLRYFNFDHNNWVTLSRKSPVATPYLMIIMSWSVTNHQNIQKLSWSVDYVTQSSPAVPNEAPTGVYAIELKTIWHVKFVANRTTQDDSWPNIGNSGLHFRTFFSYVWILVPLHLCSFFTITTWKIWILSLI